MDHFESLIQPDSFHWKNLKSHLSSDEVKYSEVFIDQLRKLALGSNYAVAQLVKYPDIIASLSSCDNFDLQAEKLVNSLLDITDINVIKKQLRIYRHQKLCAGS